MRLLVNVLLIALLLSACSPPQPTSPPSPQPTAAPPTAAPAASPTPPPALASIEGRVWEDVCPAADPARCTDLGRGPQPNGQPETDELALEGIVIQLGLGQCPAAGHRTAITGPDGRYAFTDLVPGTYCLVIDPVDGRHAGRLLPGRWSAPTRGTDGGAAIVNVTLSADNAGTRIDFGWERLSLPTPPSADTPEPICSDKAAFVQDISIPDDTPLAPGTPFVKTWRVLNAGRCVWDTAYSLAYASGATMDGPAAVPLAGTVSPDQVVDVSVSLRAPTEAGAYQGEWQLRDPLGQVLDTLWVRILVVQPTPSGAAPTATSAPPTAPPPTATSRPPALSSFELGGQVGSFSAPERMRTAGMTWVKRQLRWNPGDGASSTWIDEAHARGFKILLSVVGHPEVAADDENYPAYASFVGELARRGADAIEIWNEMNIDREWLRGQISPAAYTGLLQQSYQAIKAQNPNTLVLSGALAPTGAEGAFGTDRVWNDDRYLAGMAAAGAARYMDCVGVHYNEGILSPTQSSGDPRGDYYTRYYSRMVEVYHAAFGQARPLCFTELGYLSGEGFGPLPPAFGWAGSTSLAQQAQWLGEAVSLARSSGRVRLMIVFNVDLTRYDDDPQAGYAILRPDGTCPACESLRTAVGGR